MLTMTERAAERVRHFAGEMPEAVGRELRIFVQAGGCSGVQYGFTFDEHQDGDTVVEAGGIRILVDPQSAPFLTGAAVDYVDDERGVGFVVDSPTAARACGCGSSSCC
jgi:iron-sulfur cluster assembly accessory protein